MKTNITLLSQSRELFGVTIRQETKTGNLNLSDLQHAYDSARSDFGWSEKRFTEILSYSANRERIYYVLEKQSVIKTSLNAFMEMIEREGITKVLKSYGAYTTKGARNTKSVWCNPYIWVLVAMEMNPMLYGEVVTWLTDRLILNRIEAGDMYKGLTKAITKFKDVDYSALGKALNFIVFGKHEPGIRNKGTEEQLLELHRLELNLSFAIEAGLIKSFDNLMEHLRKQWAKKYNPIAA